uniref:Uncharacterized protein n=1 Tax=viral metagenome TaxID=1070528 RepID=A0A6H1ZM07_9ZZZZ
MPKREQFDRYQLEVAQAAGTMIIVDNTEIPTAYKRVYTTISIVSDSLTMTKIRAGLHHDARNHFYEEEPNPIANVYYNTAREYHTRLESEGVVAIHDVAVGDIIVIIWHGYEQKLENA